jgi:predicted small lipoprotein YifL
MIGCGQIGALYLPEQEQENNRTAISTNTTRSETSIEPSMQSPT